MLPITNPAAATTPDSSNSIFSKSIAKVAVFQIVYARHIARVKSTRVRRSRAATPPVASAPTGSQLLGSLQGPSLCRARALPVVTKSKVSLPASTAWCYQASCDSLGHRGGCRRWPQLPLKLWPRRNAIPSLLDQTPPIVASTPSSGRSLPTALLKA